jgi:hypothetical protein
MPKPEFDIKSATPVLSYTGPGVVAGVPADDLSANQLARIAWIRKGDKRPLSPNDMKDSDIAAVRDELAAGGNYQKTKPVEPEQPVT